MRNLALILLLAIAPALRGQQTVAQLRETASLFQRQGDYTNALLVLNRALQQAPTDISLLTDIIYVHYLQRDFAKALELIKPVVEREDAEVRTYQVAGNIYKSLEELTLCDKMYRKAIKKYPESGALLSEYGELMLARKEPDAAIPLWEKGMQADPGHSGNYYHATRFYFARGEMVRSIVCAEIFLNIESYSARATEVKEQLLEAYKTFFLQTGTQQDSKRKRPPFEEAFARTLEAQSPIAGLGIDVNKLIMIRTRFILDWFEGPAREFPHRMIELQQYLLREGLFEAYNQWLFGAASNVLEFQNWTALHDADMKEFGRYQRNRVFRMPAGQYYGAEVAPK